MVNAIYKITEDFEKNLSDYTGDPHVICSFHVRPKDLYCKGWIVI